jgi:hypothetical protein
MILIKIAYLIFKEHMEVVYKQDVFNIIQNALSYLFSDQSNVKSDYDLLETNFEIEEAT